MRKEEPVSVYAPVASSLASVVSFGPEEIAALVAVTASIKKKKVVKKARSRRGTRVPPTTEKLIANLEYLDANKKRKYNDGTEFKPARIYFSRGFFYAQAAPKKATGRRYVTVRARYPSKELLVKHLKRWKFDVVEK